MEDLQRYFLLYLPSGNLGHPEKGFGNLLLDLQLILIQVHILKVIFKLKILQDALQYILPILPRHLEQFPLRIRTRSSKRKLTLRIRIRIDIHGSQAHSIAEHMLDILDILECGRRFAFDNFLVVFGDPASFTDLVD